jgi:hypothetical protein
VVRQLVGRCIQQSVVKTPGQRYADRVQKSGEQVFSTEPDEIPLVNEEVGIRELLYILVKKLSSLNRIDLAG